MASLPLTKTFLRLPPSLRSAVLRLQVTSAYTRFASTSSLPRVAQTSFWQLIIPKFLRNKSRESQSPGHALSNKGKDWNPATPFIILGILVGSQAIHLINLRSDMVNFSRKSDAKIAQLREVIKRVQSGEDVDVSKVLGTGDPTSEGEWEEVMKEIEKSDHIWQEKKWRVRRREKAQATAADSSTSSADPSRDADSSVIGAASDQVVKSTQERRPRYY